MNSNLQTFWENSYQIGTSSPTKGRIRPFGVNTDQFGYTANECVSRTIYPPNIQPGDGG